MELDIIENALKADVKQVKAYSSVYDDKARYPAKNFTDVTQNELKKEKFDFLLLQSGSVDISNLDTKSKPEENAAFFKQEVIVSAQNIFSAAESALACQPNLEKVILMNQTPRYDEVSVDPLSLKPALAQLFNNTLTDLWIDSKFKDKLAIGIHNLECTGGIKEARYRDIRSGKYDGFHMYGPSGKKAYTISVLNILKAAGIFYQMDGQTANTFYINHLNFQYQKRKQNRYPRNNGQHSDSVNNKDVRQKKWSDSVNDKDVRQKKHNEANNHGQRYSVPTNNRFDHLNY